MTETEIEILRDIRELLTLIAEPQLESRDKKRRDDLRKVAGRSNKNIAAIMLMSGLNSQKEIAKRTNFDSGNLSRLVKALASAELLDANSENPKIVIPLSTQLFEQQ
jgi:hypothetical protein